MSGNTRKTYFEKHVIIALTKGVMQRVRHPADPLVLVSKSSARAKEFLDVIRPRISRSTTEEDLSYLASKPRLDSFSSELGSVPATDDSLARTELANAV